MHALRTHMHLKYHVIGSLDLTVPWVVSLLGAAGCLVVMFMVDPGWTFASIALVIAIHFILMRKNIEVGFRDVRESVIFYFSRLAVRNKYKDRSARRIFSPNATLGWVMRRSDARTSGRSVADLGRPNAQTLGRLSSLFFFFFQI